MVKGRLASISGEELHTSGLITDNITHSTWSDKDFKVRMIDSMTVDIGVCYVLNNIIMM